MKRIEEIRARLKAATPGPWKFSDTSCNSLYSEVHREQIIGSCLVPYEWETEWTMSNENIRLVAHAPSDLAALCDALEVAIEALDYVSEDTPRATANKFLYPEQVAARDALDAIGEILK